MFVVVYLYALGFNLSLMRNMTAINIFGKLISWQIERAHIFKPAEESSEIEFPDVQLSQANRVLADNNVESYEDLGSETDVSNPIDLRQVYLLNYHWSNNLDTNNLGFIFSYSMKFYKPNVLMKHEWQNFCLVYKPDFLIMELSFSHFSWLLLVLAEQENMLPHLEILKIFCPSVENGSGSEKRFSDTISSTILDRENQENHQPENVWTWLLWDVYFSFLTCPEM